jgi:hypothetical protein
MNEQKELAGKEYKFEAAVANANVEEKIVTSKDLSDPVFIAQLMYSLKDERERTNSLIATAISKIEKLEMQVEKLEGELGKARKKEKTLLGEVDSELLGHVKKMRMVTAEEVQKHFSYKGRNGASSRLHRLFSLGYLDKRQAGRKVHYIIK